MVKPVPMYQNAILSKTAARQDNQNHVATTTRHMKETPGHSGNQTNYAASSALKNAAVNLGGISFSWELISVISLNINN